MPMIHFIYEEPLSEMNMEACTHSLTSLMIILVRITSFDDLVLAEKYDECTAIWLAPVNLLKLVDIDFCMMDVFIPLCA